MLVFLLVSMVLAWMLPVVLLWLVYMSWRPAHRPAALRLAIIMIIAGAIGWQFQYMKAAHTSDIAWIFAASFATASAIVYALVLTVRAIAVRARDSKA